MLKSTVERLQAVGMLQRTDFLNRALTSTSWCHCSATMMGRSVFGQRAIMARIMSPAFSAWSAIEPTISARRTM